MGKLNRKVPMQNILYIFSYVWDKVKYIKNTFLDSTDDFEAVDILAKLYIDNVNTMISRGIYQTYKENQDEIRGIKGKIDFRSSINQLSLQNAKAVCIFDELNIDNVINRIIKTTGYNLYHTNGISRQNKKELSYILAHFGKVKRTILNEKTFSDIRFNRNNYYTYFIIEICDLIYNSLMLSEEKGKFEFIDILDNDEIMNKVFELFVYRYYQKNLPKEYKVLHGKKLYWNIKENETGIIPGMVLDVYIENEEESIIIDTKYYEDVVEESQYIPNKRILKARKFISNICIYESLEFREKNEGNPFISV